MAISPYYATLIDPNEPGCPVRRQAEPDPMELVHHEEERRNRWHA